MVQPVSAIIGSYYGVDGALYSFCRHLFIIVYHLQQICSLHVLRVISESLERYGRISAADIRVLVRYSAVGSYPLADSFIIISGKIIAGLYAALSYIESFKTVQICRSSVFCLLKKLFCRFFS